MSAAERWRLRVFEFVDAPGVNARVFANLRRRSWAEQFRRLPRGLLGIAGLLLGLSGALLLVATQRRIRHPADDAFIDLEGAFLTYIGEIAGFGLVALGLFLAGSDLALGLWSRLRRPGR